MTNPLLDRLKHHVTGAIERGEAKPIVEKRAAPLIGQRVEIAPHYDLWMRGARMGVVSRVYTDARGVEMVAVKMDHPQVRKLARMPSHDVTVR